MPANLKEFSVLCFPPDLSTTEKNDDTDNEKASDAGRDGDANNSTRVKSTALRKCARCFIGGRARQRIC